MGTRFRRQVPIGMWIVDFASLQSRIVIEVDGESHDYRDERVRTSYIESVGFEILRFDNLAIADNLEGVLSVITKAVTRVSSPEGGFRPQ